MSRFVFIPGAGGVAWVFGRVARILEERGHEAVAVDLPGDDERVGLADYADIVVRAIGAPTDFVLVAQSLGGFTAPLVCERKTPSALVLLNAMIPIPGETPGRWWDATGATKARVQAANKNGYSPEFDVQTYFLHDISDEVARESAPHVRSQSERIFKDRCDFTAWPKIPIRVLAGRDDRFFPIDFQRRLARARLGVDAEEIGGGHLLVLSNPEGLAAALLK
jgi:pimeloyl-ACP methyl ester carboxylesterase